MTLEVTQHHTFHEVDRRCFGYEAASWGEKPSDAIAKVYTARRDVPGALLVLDCNVKRDLTEHGNVSLWGTHNNL